MVAPPGQLPATIASALSKLSKTPDDVPNFMITFALALGPLLASTRKDAQAGNLNKSHTHTIKLLKIMYDCLLSCMSDNNDIIDMTTDCGPDAHHYLNWLQLKHAPTTTASAVQALLSIFQKDFLGDDIVAGIEKNIATNDALPDEINLEDTVLAILILVELTENLNTFVDIIGERDMMHPCEKHLARLNDIGLSP